MNSIRLYQHYNPRVLAMLVVCTVAIVPVITTAIVLVLT